MSLRLKGGGGLTDRALKTGMKSSKGRWTSCHPGMVSKLLQRFQNTKDFWINLQKHIPSQFADVLNINLYLCLSPLIRSLIPSYSEKSKGGSKFFVRTEANPPLFAEVIFPLQIELSSNHFGTGFT